VRSTPKLLNVFMLNVIYMSYLCDTLIIHYVVNLQLAPYFTIFFSKILVPILIPHMNRIKKLVLIMVLKRF